MRSLVIGASLCLAACNPPPAEDYAQRVDLKTRDAPSAPIDSPDTQDAVWVPSGEQRIVYGLPGSPPLMALACVIGDRGEARIAYTRFAEADDDAKAILALIGNGHVARLFVDAEEDGERWIWRGSVPAGSTDLETLTGPRRIEATVPGAGSVILNPSALPGELITACRGPGLPDPEESPA